MAKSYTECPWCGALTRVKRLNNDDMLYCTACNRAVFNKDDQEKKRVDEVDV
jgi:uncharacterized paraquat-inducible protein A